MAQVEGLANQYRPMVWEDMIGQEPIKRFFKNSLGSGRLRSVYLLPGLHGSGKTTASKILSRWINCDNRQGHNPCNQCRFCSAALRGQSPVTLEVDGTSQNRAEFVEAELMGFLRTQPPPNKYHVAVIDEFHRIKDPARSMFLPFLEFMDIERPRSIAILCTTELASIDKPLISRACIPGTFQGLNPEQVIIRYAEKLQIQPEICQLILKVSGGSMRQFWNTYDVLRELEDPAKLTPEVVLEWAGGVTDQERHSLWTAVHKRDRKKVKELWEKWMSSNKSGFDFVVTQLLEDLDRFILENPDMDDYIDAHQKIAMALSYATHPAARVNQLVLGALYGMKFGGTVKELKPKATAKPVETEMPAKVTTVKNIPSPEPITDDLDDSPPVAPVAGPGMIPENTPPRPEPVAMHVSYLDDLGD